MTIHSKHNNMHIANNGRRILMPNEDLLTGGNNTGSLIIGNS